jgi:O-methyltransferase
MINSIQKKREEYKEKGYALIRYDDKAIHSFPYDSPWIDDKEFSEIYDKINKNTLVDRSRCYSLYLIANQARKIKGNAIEVGVWRGGTAGILTKVLKDKKVYLADTFEGVVKSSGWEHYSDSAHSDTTQDLVQNFLKNTMKVDNYEIIKGIFPEESGSIIESESFSLAYLDLDVYLSTKDAFNFIWPKMNKNGIVVFDDYGMISACEGIYRFVNEIKHDNDKIFFQNMNGQAYIIKI